ncbi:hypothetical protein [Nocardia terrae]|uniref:hypothetical protein n=1 Tax=Nocardia terrae TaxID=2675851 RepID=UPI0012F7D51C|nr:hypothetical protein [Nocardia terrae]
MVRESFPTPAVRPSATRRDLSDIIASHGVDAVLARVAVLRAFGYRTAASAVERELQQLGRS